MRLHQQNQCPHCYRQLDSFYQCDCSGHSMLPQSLFENQQSSSDFKSSSQYFQDKQSCYPNSELNYQVDMNTANSLNYQPNISQGSPSQPLFSESLLGSFSKTRTFMPNSMGQITEEIISQHEKQQWLTHDQGAKGFQSLSFIQAEDNPFSSTIASKVFSMIRRDQFNFQVDTLDKAPYKLDNQNFFPQQPQSFNQIPLGFTLLDLPHHKIWTEEKQTQCLANERKETDIFEMTPNDESLYPNPSPSLSESLQGSPNDLDLNANERENEMDEENIITKNKEEGGIHKEEDTIWEADMDNSNKKEELLKRIEDVNSDLWKENREDDDSYLKDMYLKMGKNNRVKNILQMFVTFVLERGDEVVVESLGYNEKELPKIRKELKNFLRLKSLNNNTLLSFLRSKRYSKQFLYYLRFYAVEYFLESKVLDKDSHLICIAFFYRCKYSYDLQTEIKIYNKSKYFKKLPRSRIQKPKQLISPLEIRIAENLDSQLNSDEKQS